MLLGARDCFQRFAASRSGDEPRLCLHKYKQNFKLIIFPIANKSRASPFLETAVARSLLFVGSNWFNVCIQCFTCHYYIFRFVLRLLLFIIRFFRFNIRSYGYVNRNCRFVIINLLCINSVHGLNNRNCRFVIWFLLFVIIIFSYGIIN